MPWWAWALAAGMVAAVVVSVRLGHPGVPWWATTALVGAVATLGLVRLGRARVTVLEDADGGRTLRAGAAALPGRFVAGVDVVAAADKQRVLGPELDPLAYVLHRPWIGPLLRLELADPADPTPYWLVSARHPEAVRALLGDPGAAPAG